MKRLKGKQFVGWINKILSKCNLWLSFLLRCSYAESVGATHFETSAKNNIGVEDLFLGLTNMVTECRF